MNQPFKISVNDRFQFEISPDQANELDIVPNGTNHFHTLKDGQSYQISLLETNYPERYFVLSVNGRSFKVHINDYYERLIEQLGLSTVGTSKQNTIKAPMPGLVLHIMVTTGDVVKKGDTLLILEAMKMENVLKAADDGVIKSVVIAKGAAVEKGQLLIEME